MKQKYLYSTVAILSILTTISLVLLGIYLPRYWSLQEQVKTNLSHQIQITAQVTENNNTNDETSEPLFEAIYNSQKATLAGVLSEHPEEFSLSGGTSAYGQALLRVGNIEANFASSGDYWDITSPTHLACAGQNSTNSCTEGVSFLYLARNEHFIFVLHGESN